ncbi:hypothetical protein [Enterococcus durans]|nr:hypothetical protein [Enterococcus durans]
MRKIVLAKKVFTFILLPFTIYLYTVVYDGSKLSTVVYACM